MGPELLYSFWKFMSTILIYDLPYVVCYIANVVQYSNIEFISCRNYHQYSIPIFQKKILCFVIKSTKKYYFVFCTCSILKCVSLQIQYTRYNTRILRILHMQYNIRNMQFPQDSPYIRPATKSKSPFKCILPTLSRLIDVYGDHWWYPEPHSTTCNHSGNVS